MQREAFLYEKLEEMRVRCSLCAHHCSLKPSQYGICGVRQNVDGTLYTVVYGEPIARHVDPIEKKPLYHFLAGSSSYSIAAMGCNFRCGFCQNWQISQRSKRDNARLANQEVEPARIVREAVGSKCRSISYTYTEPTVFFEYAYDTARLAKDAGLYNTFVTNGFMTKKTLEMIRPYLDAANVDLKSFRDDFYVKICGGRLQPVLDSITTMKGMGIWVEITTLVIPDANDGDEELHEIARFISELDCDIPWHLSRFHPDYKFAGRNQATPLSSLQNAEKIGRSHGLRYVYLGNVAADVNTYCFRCGRLLIDRSIYSATRNSIRSGTCPDCGSSIGGLWD